MALSAAGCSSHDAGAPEAAKTAAGTAAKVPKTQATASKAAVAKDPRGPKAGSATAPGTLAHTTEHSASSLTPPPRGSLQKMPTLMGLRFGMTVAQAQAALKKRARKLGRPRHSSTSRFGVPVRTTRLYATMDPAVAGGIKRFKLYFWADALARYKVYGDDVGKTLQKRLGRPDADAGRAKYWLSEADLRGIRCKTYRCELFDLRILVKKKSATHARLAREFARLIARMDHEVRRYEARKRATR